MVKLFDNIGQAVNIVLGRDKPPVEEIGGTGTVIFGGMLSEVEYAMVLIAGSRLVSWRALRQFFQQSRLTIASPEEVEEETGYQIGAVSPFGLPKPLQILLDESVLSQPAVSLGSGVEGTAILITTENLLEALGDVEVGQFAAP